MAFTPTLSLPLPDTPHASYANLLADSTGCGQLDEALKKGISERCLVCGLTSDLCVYHIIPEEEAYEFMRGMHYSPSNAKSVDCEPRNAILLCLNHYSSFENHDIYVRWMPETDEFVAVEHNRKRTNSVSIHGSVLDIHAATTKDCPFPTAFLWHECRVRACNPTCGDQPVNLLRGAQRGPYWSLPVRSVSSAVTRTPTALDLGSFSTLAWHKTNALEEYMYN
ncbi:hypothetical protein BDN70DRAFT_996718 [Pholiota conissans]|uniref:HNH nuclease domain-containing protein n=1 Tax=Pholiota conissans TaxID=109636 RepID=A0A9P5YSI5_9AGAR|nr:hypothetical protein BDN70DRAFT_996718 [Pholiota conissans]